MTKCSDCWEERDVNEGGLCAECAPVAEAFKKAVIAVRRTGGSREAAFKAGSRAAVMEQYRRSYVENKWGFLQCLDYLRDHPGLSVEAKDAALIAVGDLIDYSKAAAEVDAVNSQIAEQNREAGNVTVIEEWLQKFRSRRPVKANPMTGELSV